MRDRACRQAKITLLNPEDRGPDNLARNIAELALLHAELLGLDSCSDAVLEIVLPFPYRQ